MKKLSNYVLVLITTIGGILASEGIITGEALTATQNIVGLALSGGGLTALTVINLLGTIPISVTNSIYDKAKAKFGESKVNGILDNLVQVPEMFDKMVELVDTVNSFKEELLLNRDINAANGVYDNLDPELKERLDNIK